MIQPFTTTAETPACAEFIALLPESYPEKLPAYMLADYQRRLEVLTGVAVLVFCATDHGDSIHIHFTIPHTEKPFRLECNVTHCNMLSGITGEITLQSLVSQEEFDQYIIETNF